MEFSDRIIGLAGGQITLDVATGAADSAQLRRFFDRPAEGRA
jgi:ABC-type phosphate/phosphonate transport system ATPase subunit